GIGLTKGSYQQFLETLAGISGGKYYWVRDSRPAELAAPLEKRFRDIRKRVKSQHYVSWYAEPYGAAGEKPADKSGNVRREVRIRSLDARCRIPHDGYRPERSLPGPVRRSVEKGRGTSAPDEAGVRAVHVKLGDVVLDSEPLIRYGGDPPGTIIARRTVEILLPPAIED